MFHAYNYTCSCGASMEDYFHDTRDGDPPEHFDCPRCGVAGALSRVRVYALRPFGPLWSKIDDMEARMFSAKQRRMGMQIRSNKDISAWENEQGLFRPTETEQRVWSEESRHDGCIIRKIQRESGSEAATDYVDTTEIMDATGWDKKETEAWKERQNAVRIDPSAFEPAP